MEYKTLKKVYGETPDECAGRLPYAVTGHSRQTRHRGRDFCAQTRVGEHGARRAPSEQWSAHQGGERCGACPPHPDRSADGVVGAHATDNTLRDGLLELRYRENEQFILGVR